MTPLGDAALSYVARGWHIFPLHSISNGSCTCGSNDCNSPGKHPLTQQGFKNATTDAGQIQRWWTQYPDANIGIATGIVSTLVVVDVDGDTGKENFQNLLQALGLSLNTLMSHTGGGGCHWFFEHPGVTIKNDVGKKLGLNIDIRGDGGYIVAPPSRHVSGKLYNWNDLRRTPEKMPKGLLAMIVGRQLAVTPETIVCAISEGQRHSKLVSLAGAMRRHGAEQQTVVAALLNDNQRRCQPPLPDREVKSIASSVHKYPPACQIEHLTDMGNARRLVIRHGPDLRFCHVWKIWMVWNGTLWKADTTGEVERRAKETALSIYDEVVSEPDADKRKAISRWAQISESHGRIVAMIKLAESETGVSVPPDQFDSDPFLLNCRNGTLDLQSGDLREHRRQDLCTKQVACDYAANAICPIWSRFLEEIMGGNPRLIEFLQRAIGYALTGSTIEQVLFIEYGSGANGKGTLNETVKALLGNYAQSADSSLLTVRKSEAVRSDVARLAGARFVSTSETESGKQLAEALIKQMTGDDTIVSRHLYQKEFEYVPQYKIFLGTNYKPVIKGTDVGIWRRIRLVPFQVTIPEAKRDKILKEKIRAEFPGILAWAVRGCLEWQKAGLQPPLEVTNATESYRQDMDVITDFINVCCRLGKSLKTAAAALYEAYRAHCEHNGEQPSSMRELGEQLTQRGFERKRGRYGWFRLGIGLVTDVTRGDPDSESCTPTTDMS